MALRPDDTCDVTDVERSKLQTFVAHLTESLDVAVLKNPVFVIYAFSCILCMAGRSTGLLTSCAKCHMSKTAFVKVRL